MAFDFRQFTLIKNTGTGPRLWSFNTNDSPAFVKAANYFNPAAPWLRDGDWIFFESGDGSLTTMDCALVVLSVAAGVVTIANKSVDV
jgi:hypothetical protein